MAHHAVAREDIHALRQMIGRIEGTTTVAGPADPARESAGFADGMPSRLPLGPALLDEALGGGFPVGGLSEIRSGETRDWGSACAFTLAIIAILQAREARLAGPLVWITAADAQMEGGEIWMPGIAGLVPCPQVLFVRPRKVVEALWAAETAAACAGVGAVIVEIRGNPACLGLTESRRLHMRARASVRPLFLLRQAGVEEATAAPSRFCVAAAPAASRLLSGGRRLPGSLGAPAFAVTLEKSRLPAPLPLILEWTSDECRLDIRSPAGVADALPALPARQRPGGPADPGAGLSLSSDRPDHPGTPGTVVAFARAS